MASKINELVGAHMFSVKAGIFAHLDDVDYYLPEIEKNLKEKIKQLFQELLDEVIGEDTVTIHNYSVGLTHKDETNNALRKKQRLRTKELLEEL